MTDAQRFGLEAEPTPDSSESPYEYFLPKGWSPTPPKPMRELDFSIAGAPEIECYVMTLKGDGGGIEANIDRWREQMGQAPLAAGEIDRLQRIPLFGVSGALVELRGDYQGMDGPKRSDQALIGVIGSLPDRTVFIKMIGPANAVAAQREAFLEFCKSMRLKS